MRHYHDGEDELAALLFFAAVSRRFFPKAQFRPVLPGTSRVRISGISGSTSPEPGHG